VVDVLEMLVVDLGPYITVRGKAKPDGTKPTALSSSVLKTLTGYTWDMTVPVQDWEEGAVPFRDRRAASCLDDAGRAKVAGIWSRKDATEIRTLPNPILIEDIPRDLRQIIFQTCEDLRCMKETHFHDTRTSAIMLAIHEQNKSATMERLMELSKQGYLKNRRNAFVLKAFGSMKRMVSYVKRHGWGALTRGSVKTPFGKAFLRGPAPADRERTQSEKKWNPPEFYAWLRARAQPHGDRRVYQMKEDEATRLIAQWIGSWRFDDSCYRPAWETDSIGVPAEGRIPDHNEGAGQPFHSKNYESDNVWGCRRHLSTS